MQLLLFVWVYANTLVI